MWQTWNRVDKVASVTIVESMHDNDEAKIAPEDFSSEEHDPKIAEGTEESKAQEQKEGEEEPVLEPPFGVDANRQVIEQALGMFITAMQQLLNRKRPPTNSQEQIPQPPPAEVTMPQGLAKDLLLELYKPDEKQTDNRQFRGGMGLGAAINMMGVQVLSEDLLHMITNLLNRGGKTSKRDPLELLRMGVAQPAWPIRYGVAIPPEDPFPNSPGYDEEVGVAAHHAMDPEQFSRWARYQKPEPMRASGEGLGFAGIPPMPDIGPQMREEAKVRWERMQQNAPEKAEKMKAQGFNGVEDLFDHFEELFSDFFPGQKSATAAPNTDDPHDD